MREVPLYPEPGRFVKRGVQVGSLRTQAFRALIKKSEPPVPRPDTRNPNLETSKHNCRLVERRVQLGGDSSVADLLGFDPET